MEHKTRHIEIPNRRTEPGFHTDVRPSPPMTSGYIVWYALAGLAIVFSLYLFVTSPAESIRQMAVAVFIGLWAPMFAILGLRAELLRR